MARTIRTHATTPGFPQLASGVVSVAIAAVLIAGAVALSGCTTGTTSAGKGSKETTRPVGMNMAGPAQTVVVSKQAVAAKPQPWNLKTPESAVRSYLDWMSYAYRITESSVGTPTMGDKQEVKVDSYIQYNLQQSRILDQNLVSITFGKPSQSASGTLLPAVEKWDYRYMSISKVGKVLAGPYTASYDTTYTVARNKKGDWVVQQVAVSPVGAVK